MSDYHEKQAYFQQLFPDKSFRSATHFLEGFAAVENHMELLLEGLGRGINYMSCDFPLPSGWETFDGVKFSHGLDVIWESIVSYDIFLSMMRAAGHWRLRTHPEEEVYLRCAFHSRNLALEEDGADFPNQDDGITWWNKCREKIIVHQSLRHSFEADYRHLWVIDYFFLYLTELQFLDFLRAATNRIPYVGLYQIHMEFPEKNLVQFTGTLITGPVEERRPDIVRVSSDTFDNILHKVATAYAERRPQHANEVAELMSHRRT